MSAPKGLKAYEGEPDIFKPNLAGTPKDDSDIPMPCLASPKIDGIRAMVHPEGLKSRTMKDIPSKYAQELLRHPLLLGLDGELVVGSPTDPNCMHNTTSGIMARDKKPDFKFLVFDSFDHEGGYNSRSLHIATRVMLFQELWEKESLGMVHRLEGAPTLECPVQLVPHTLIHTLEGLNSYEAEQLALGYEGVMVRSPHGAYKQGRSTAREGGLLKIKRFVDGEFLIVGFEEQMKNNNAKVINELGRSKRSSHAAGKSGKGTLGAFKARCVRINDKGHIELGEHFSIGSGMDDNFRAWAWANRDKLMGKYGVYKSFPIGVKDAPRHPVFKTLREKWDMS